MPSLPPQLVALLAVFAPAFSRPTFARALVLLCGTLLASGRRTVAAALRAVGLAEDPHFGAYHRVLSRAGTHARVGTPLHGYPLGVLFGLFSIVAGYPRTGVGQALHPDQLPARAA